MIFDYNHYNIDLKKLIKLSGLTKINILDFGFNLFDPVKMNNKNINKIIKIDREKKLINFLKKNIKQKK